MASVACKPSDDVFPVYGKYNVLLYPASPDTLEADVEPLIKYPLLFFSVELLVLFNTAVFPLAVQLLFHKSISGLPCIVIVFPDSADVLLNAVLNLSQLA